MEDVWVRSNAKSGLTHNLGLTHILQLNVPVKTISNSSVLKHGAQNIMELFLNRSDKNLNLFSLNAPGKLAFLRGCEIKVFIGSRVYSS
jgi:hypothetical protein